MRAVYSIRFHGGFDLPPLFGQLGEELILERHLGFAQEIREAGRQLVITEFSTERVAAAMRDLYTSIVRNNPSAPPSR